MDKYTLQEQAYKRGFQNGFAEGAEREASLSGYIQMVAKSSVGLAARAKLNSMGTDAPFLATSKTIVIIVVA